MTEEQIAEMLELVGRLSAKVTKLEYDLVLLRREWLEHKVYHP